MSFEAGDRVMHAISHGTGTVTIPNRWHAPGALVTVDWDNGPIMRVRAKYLQKIEEQELAEG